MLHTLKSLIHHPLQGLTPLPRLFSLASCLLPLAFFLSCTSSLTPQQYLDYFERNRAKATKVIERNDVKATLVYMPPEYYVARDMQSDPTLPFDSVSRKYENSIFFVLGIKGKKFGGGSVLLERQGIAGFKDNVVRTTFDHYQDIFLLRGTDTVKTAGYNYNRNWGVGNDDMFLIAFGKKSLKAPLSAYNLIIREITPELGTLDIKVKDISFKTRHVKG